jgi:EAL domain-containing protein (putative c-di-GMP-specific phosphodiesterase class I)
MIFDVAPDYLKMDAYFVQGCTDDPRRQAVLSLLQDFGGRFGSQLIAEGIESAADHDTVRRLGVPLLQGYLISRPVPLDQARLIAGAPSLRISSMNAVEAAPPPHLS